MKAAVPFIVSMLWFCSNAQQLLSKKEILQGNRYSDSLSFFDITYLSDGLRVKGFIVEPKHGKHLPVVIFNRGGNQDFAMINHALLEQWLAPIAKQGYVVVASQYRGSAGSEGKDEMGGKDVNDVLNLFPVISKLPNVDTNRIAMYGWSRGGIMTYRAIAQTDRIKTAIIGASPTDLERENKQRPKMDSICSVLIPSYKTNRTKELQKRSVIYWPEKICPTTSLLLLYGTDDWRVDYTDAQQLSGKLKALDHKHTLLLFEGDDHNLTKNRTKKDSIILSWLKENL